MVSEIKGGGSKTQPLCVQHSCTCGCVCFAFVRQRRETEIEVECEYECVCACIKKTRERSLRQPAHLLSHL